MTNVQPNPEPRGKIEDLTFGKLNGKYRAVQIAGAVLVYSALAAMALLLLISDNIWWCVIAECMIIAVFVFNIMILREAYLFKGYALREHDISYRTGMIFPKITTIPYRRIQQVSIEQNPVSKFFGLYSVEVVNGAQTLSSLTIPGLTEDMARQIKNCITEKLADCND